MALAKTEYYTDTKVGRVFVGTTAAAGVVLPIYTNTSQTFVLWNPLGSGKDIVPIRINYGYVDTTGAAANHVIGYQTGVGSQAATGSPITAITLGTPVNLNLDDNTGSVAKFAPATATFASAPSLLMTLGISQLVTTAATTSAVPWKQSYDFDGQLIVPPGVAIVAAGNIAQLSKWDVSLIWAEIDR